MRQMRFQNIIQLKLKLHYGIIKAIKIKIQFTHFPEKTLQTEGFEKQVWKEYIL